MWVEINGKNVKASEIVEFSVNTEWVTVTEGETNKAPSKHVLEAIVTICANHKEYIVKTRTDVVKYEFVEYGEMLTFGRVFKSVWFGVQNATEDEKYKFENGDKSDLTKKALEDRIAIEEIKAIELNTYMWKKKIREALEEV